MIEESAWKTPKGKYLCVEHRFTSRSRNLTPVDRKEGQEHKCDVCKAKQEQLKLRHRNSTCIGCRSNRYNFESNGERPGIDAPTSGEGCWSLSGIKNGKCGAYGRY